MTRRPARLAQPSSPGLHPSGAFPLFSGALLLTALCVPGDVAAQHNHGEHRDAAGASPYTDLTDREVKALSAEEIQGLLEGEGMGFALAAELNGHPGPRHVLDLADELELSADQLAATQAVFEEMSGAARSLGKELVEAERDLDRRFAEGTPTDAEVTELTGRIGILQGELRGVHLRAHLAMDTILSMHQRHMYARLRGYDTASRNSGAGVDTR